MPQTTIKQFTIERVQVVALLILLLIIIVAMQPELINFVAIPLGLVLLWALKEVLFNAKIIVQLDEYEKGVILRRGKFHRTVSSGWIFLIPLLEQIIIVDTREQTLNLPPQYAYTADEVKVNVDMVAFYKIVNPTKAVIKVHQIKVALEEFVRSALRDIIGNLTTMELISEIEKVNDLMKAKIEPYTMDWGVEILAVQITNIALPPSIEYSMQQLKKQKGLWAATRWEAKAKQMEIEALAKAAKGLDDKALKYLYLKEALPKISEGKGSKVFVPIDLSEGDIKASIAALGLDHLTKEEKEDKPKETKQGVPRGPHQAPGTRR
jgi:regulator of protease activity HflC (stomatin/prohibitin superfamily)